MIGDPYLNYLALGILFFVVVVLFYGVIAIHDIPYRIAHSREHPHQDAIHAAGWVSLFTLHALWPFLWIWAMAYKPDRGWGIHHPSNMSGHAPGQNEIDTLRARLAAIESRLGIENSAPLSVVPSFGSGDRSKVEAIGVKADVDNSSQGPTVIAPSFGSGDRARVETIESKVTAGDR
jgi:hypothetical protein